MRRLALVSLVLLFLPAVAGAHERDGASCEEVRRVRALAVRQGLDDRLFDRLEMTACPVAPEPSGCPLPQSGATGDCADLYRMSMLAFIAGDRDQVAQIETQRVVTCTLRTTPRSFFDWPNGRTAKYGSSWDYPNGRTAKYGSSWDWPNGRTAHYGGSWDYPNGVTAKYGTNSWQAPNGQGSSLEEVLTWSCNKLGRDECLEQLGRIQRLSGDERDIAIIAFAWSASQR